MNSRINHPLFVSARAAGLVLMLAGSVAAQTFSTLYSFNGGVDGAHPQGGLVLWGSALYGTASLGGSGDEGTVFAVDGDGKGFTNLYAFSALPDSGNNGDGANPQAGLILFGNTFYGTASYGGTSGDGTVFALKSDDGSFANLYSFTAASAVFINADGAFPQAGLISSGDTLYGTASYGGSSGNGTVFKVNADGTGFTTLHSFAAIPAAPWTNRDGAYPYGGLIMAGNTLYGTASSGGGAGNGTVFKVNTDGTAFATLHSFTATPGNRATNTDGAAPYAGLVLSGNTLYGTASAGGAWTYGTVFKVNTDGTGFTTLHDFTHGADGAVPYGGLVLSGDTLYGAAEYGGLGNPGSGTLYALNTNGGSFATLYRFTAGSGTFPSITNSDGAYPQAGLILSSNTLYGTAGSGGGSANGTVFSLSLPPRLTIIPSGANVVVTWAANTGGFTLQCAANLASPSAWSPVSPGPVFINGQNTVTNAISSGQKYYRLSP